MKLKRNAWCQLQFEESGRGISGKEAFLVKQIFPNSIRTEMFKGNPSGMDQLKICLRFKVIQLLKSLDLVALQYQSYQSKVQKKGMSWRIFIVMMERKREERKFRIKLEKFKRRSWKGAHFIQNKEKLIWNKANKLKSTNFLHCTFWLGHFRLIPLRGLAQSQWPWDIMSNSIDWNPTKLLLETEKSLFFPSKLKENHNWLEWSRLNEMHFNFPIPLPI